MPFLKDSLGNSYELSNTKPSGKYLAVQKGGGLYYARLGNEVTRLKTSQGYVQKRFATNLNISVPYYSGYFENRNNWRTYWHTEMVSLEDLGDGKVIRYDALTYNHTDNVYGNTCLLVFPILVNANKETTFIINFNANRRSYFLYIGFCPYLGSAGEGNSGIDSNGINFYQSASLFGSNWWTNINTYFKKVPEKSFGTFICRTENLSPFNMGYHAITKQSGSSSLGSYSEGLSYFGDLDLTFSKPSNNKCTISSSMSNNSNISISNVPLEYSSYYPFVIFSGYRFTSEMTTWLHIRGLVLQQK